MWAELHRIPFFPHPAAHPLRNCFSTEATRYMPENRARGATNTGWTQGSAQHHACAAAHTRAGRQACLLQNEGLHLCRTEPPADLAQPFQLPSSFAKQESTEQLQSASAACTAQSKSCLCMRAANKALQRQADTRGRGKKQEAATILLFLQRFESSSNNPGLHHWNELLSILQHRQGQARAPLPHGDGSGCQSR